MFMFMHVMHVHVGRVRVRAGACGCVRPRVDACAVEFMEARFKERFAPRKCFGATSNALPGCDGVDGARQRMRDWRWKSDLNEGGSVRKARSTLRSVHSPSKATRLTHLCDGRGEPAREGTLRVPGNASAPTRRLALGPSWLFSHFPYGSFFDSFRRCHADSWLNGWKAASAVERRLCMPGHRVPAIMVHMAGLRQESWGRRVLMRALGVWQEAADAVAPEAWVSARTDAGGGASTRDDGDARVAAATSIGRLLLTDGVVTPTTFTSMGEYDRFVS
jgi:hypothetical protein